MKKRLRMPGSVTMTTPPPPLATFSPFDHSLGGTDPVHVLSIHLCVSLDFLLSEWQQIYWIHITIWASMTHRQTVSVTAEKRCARRLSPETWKQTHHSSNS
jgi:hypothetical protein